MAIIMSDNEVEAFRKHFGECLCKIREKHHLTQQALADDMGMSQSAIAYWEKGKRPIKFEDVMAFSLYFKVSMTHFVIQMNL